MKITIQLSCFYSQNDEDRFFLGLKNIDSINNIKGIYNNLIIDINIRTLKNYELRELIALLYRYNISLVPLSFLSVKKRFLWINNIESYWYSSMFNNLLKN